MIRKLLFLAPLFVATVASAQAPADPDIVFEGVGCLPAEHNRPFEATVGGEIAGDQEVRLYFRRLNPSGAWYWVPMHPAGEGHYWTVFPKAERREQTELFDDWWEILQDRDWMQVEDRDHDWLEDWLEDQEFEASEYRVAVVNPAGLEVRRSRIDLVPVWEPDHDEDDQDGSDQRCPITMTEAQWGWSQNLTIGETTDPQLGVQVFHWMCDGIVTRVSWQNIHRADENCRACVVGAGIFPVAGALPLIGTTVIRREPPEETSPSQP